MKLGKNYNVVKMTIAKILLDFKAAVNPSFQCVFVDNKLGYYDTNGNLYYIEVVSDVPEYPLYCCDCSTHFTVYSSNNWFHHIKLIKPFIYLDEALDLICN